MIFLNQLSLLSLCLLNAKAWAVLWMITTYNCETSLCKCPSEAVTVTLTLVKHYIKIEKKICIEKSCLPSVIRLHYFFAMIQFVWNSINILAYFTITSVVMTSNDVRSLLSCVVWAIPLGFLNLFRDKTLCINFRLFQRNCIGKSNTMDSGNTLYMLAVYLLILNLFLNA